MRAMLCATLFLLAGCAAATDAPGSWRTREGAPADPRDLADCQNKSTYTEAVASSRIVGQDLPRTDYTILAICMDAHGYRLSGAADVTGRPAR